MEDRYLVRWYCLYLLVQQFEFFLMKRTLAFLSVYLVENILYFTLKEFHLVSLVLEIMNFHELRQVTQLCLALASILPA